MAQGVIFTEALKLTKRGFHVGPCWTIDQNGKCSCPKKECGNSSGKHPQTKKVPNGLHNFTKDPAKLMQWFGEESEPANIAIRTGKVSGIWVLDIDDPNSIYYSRMPKTVCSESRKGRRHYYFKYVDGCEKFANSQKFGEDGSLDCRADNAYVVAPPSKHHSGSDYHWINSPEDCEILEAPEWLFQLALIGNSQKKTPQNPVKKPVSNSQVDPEDPMKPVTVKAELSLLERATKYASACPIAIQTDHGGEGGNKQTFSVICHLVEHFPSLNDDEILEALQEWNSRCIPVWENSDLLQKIPYARSKFLPSSSSKIEPEESVTKNSDDSENNSSQIASASSGKLASNSSENDLIEEFDDLDEPLFPVLSGEAYHGLLGEMIEAISSETEADPVAILVSFLTAFGNAVGKKPSFTIGNAGTHHGNLFTIIVGDTASGKGQSWGIVKTFMKKVDPIFAESLETGLNSGEGFLSSLQDEKDEEKQYLPIELQPLRKALYVQEEFKQVIEVMSRDNNTLECQLLLAWDSDQVIKSKTKNDPIQCSNHYISILGQMTPNTVRDLLKKSSHRENGFVNRHLWVYAKDRGIDLPFGGDGKVLDPFIDRFKEALEKSRTIGEMKFTAESNSLWESKYSSLKRIKGTHKASVNRARPQVIRLAMLYALLDCNIYIHPVHLEAAFSVWDYCEQTAKMLFSEEEDSALTVLELKVYGIIFNNPDCTKKTILEFGGGKGQKLKNSLKTLMDHGLIEMKLSDVKAKNGKFPEIFKAVNYGFSAITSGVVKTEELPDKIKPNFPIDPIGNPSSNEVIGFAELLNWKNENSIKFEWNPDLNMIYVTNEKKHLITESIKNAITKNQNHLSKLVGPAKTSPDNSDNPITESIKNHSSIDPVKTDHSTDDLQSDSGKDFEDLYSNEAYRKLQESLPKEIVTSEWNKEEYFHYINDIEDKRLTNTNNKKLPILEFIEQHNECGNYKVTKISHKDGLNVKIASKMVFGNKKKLREKYPEMKKEVVNLRANSDGEAYPPRPLGNWYPDKEPIHKEDDGFLAEMGITDENTKAYSDPIEDHFTNDLALQDHSTDDPKEDSEEEEDEFLRSQGFDV